MKFTLSMAKVKRQLFQSEARDIADEWLAMSVEVNKVMYKLRYYAKIEFPSDYEEE